MGILVSALREKAFSPSLPIKDEVGCGFAEYDLYYIETNSHFGDGFLKIINGYRISSKAFLAIIEMIIWVYSLIWEHLVLLLMALVVQLKRKGKG